MKNLVLILLIATAIYSQCLNDDYIQLTPEERAFAVSFLDTAKGKNFRDGLYFVNSHHISEAYEVIERRFWEDFRIHKTLYRWELQENMLDVQMYFNLPSAYRLAMAWKDSLKKDYDVLGLQHKREDLLIILVKMMYGDFSDADIIDNECNNPNPDYYREDYLFEILKVMFKAEAFKDRAYCNFKKIYVMEDHKDDSDEIVYFIRQDSSHYSIDYCLFALENESDLDLRYIIINALGNLELNESELLRFETLLQRNVVYSNDQSEVSKSMKELLKLKPTIYNYYLMVERAKKEEPDSLINVVKENHDVLYFTLPRPSNETNLLTLIDSLGNSIKECRKYEWIKGDLLFQKLNEGVLNLRNSYINNELDKTGIEIAGIIREINENYDTLGLEKTVYANHIARKFAGQLASYISERLPKPEITNLSLNPGFEDGTRSYWYASNTYGNAEFSFEVTNESPIAGSYSGKFSITKAGTSNNRPMFYFKIKEKFVPGNKYTYHFKTKVISGVPKIMYLNYGAGLKLFGNTLSGVQIWEYEITATANLEYIYFYMDGKSEGVMLIDDFEIIKP